MSTTTLTTPAPTAQAQAPQRVARKRRKLGKNQRKTIEELLESLRELLRAIDMGLYLAAEENDFSNLDELLDDRLQTQAQIDWLELRLRD